MKHKLNAVVALLLVFASGTASARFVSVDPVQANANNGTNFNRYYYANNNPYRFTDPDGRQANPFTGAGCNLDWCRQQDRQNDPMRDHLPLLQTGESGSKAGSQSSGCDETCEMQQLRGQQRKIVGDAANAMSKMGDIVEMAVPIPGLPALKVGRHTASGLARLAEKAGWKRTQSAAGPIKYMDANGVTRLTLKQGSPRTPGSEGPHAEFRDATGQRVDALGNGVARRSAENHSEIDWDMD